MASRRLVLGLLGPLVLTASCAARVEESFAFDSARLMDDGTTVLFTASHARYEGTGGGLGSSGSKTLFRYDRKILGRFELATGRTEALRILDEQPGETGVPALRLCDARGGVALVSRDTVTGALWYLFSLASRELEAIEWRRELQALGMQEFDAPVLADEKGTLIVVARTLGQAGAEEEGTPPGHLWHIPREGKPELLCKEGRFEGLLGGEVLYWRAGEGRKRWARELASGREREMLEAEISLSIGEREAAASVGEGGRSLLYERKNGEVWDRTALAVDVRRLR